MLCNSVVDVRTRPPAILLAMITMRKSTHGFISPSYRSMGLRSAALRAAGAPLKMRNQAVVDQSRPINNTLFETSLVKLQ